MNVLFIYWIGLNPLLYFVIYIIYLLLFDSNCSFWTPLMCAVDGGYPELVTLLLEKGAEVDATDSQKVK